MQELKDFLRQNKMLLLNWGTAFLLAMQVLNLHSYVVQNVDHRAILSAIDDDAAWNLRKTVNTRWWKDNGWVLYGPAYFRLNHTIHYFWGRTADDRGEGDHEIWEKTAHHAIMTISLLSLLGIGLIVSVHLLTIWWQRFLLTMGLLSGLTSIPVFSEFILRAHPDALFAFVCVAALALTLRMFLEPGKKLWFYLSAILWGISVSVKMTIGICVPGFVLLFVPPFKKENFKRGLRYLGVMFTAYFLIGFPQTIVIDRAFRAMAKMSSLSGTVTLETVLHWLYLYATQLPPLLLIIWLAALDFERRVWKVNREATWRILGFVAVPFLVLLSKHMLMPSDHYTLGFVSMALLAFAVFLPRRLTEFLPKGNHPLLRGGLFLAVILVTFGSTPKAMQVELDKMLKCRMEARDVYGRLKELYNSGKRVWVDPYVPYISDADQSRMDLSWEKSWQGYKVRDWNVMALNHDFMSRFVKDNVDEYTRADIPGWQPAQEFYRAFFDKEIATAPDGRTFRRVYQNACNQEIWIRDGD